ncbi:hypothetical protein [Corynebacterium sp. UBA2622]|uniref:hypothetical protein n=1 Tax=Corynebacterium sp. UBA2622 TaxID=1946393 RepID=UPI0025BB1E2D|nr:hypothetical protein [Corynebacterium sp. UBA2622]
MTLRCACALAAAGLALGSCTIDTGRGSDAGSEVVTSTSVVVVDPPVAVGGPEPAASPPPPAPAATGNSLQSVVDSVAAAYGGSVGIAVAGPDGVRAYGDDGAYPAWSTIKVPVAVAAYRTVPQAAAALAGPAVTQSDNAAAQGMWDALPAGAADAVLAEAGVGAQVNTAVIRPEFSTFGQTLLTASQEATLAAQLPCLAGAGPVLELMGQVAPDQRYGLGQFDGARFKGGWGPSPAGGYQVRQLGLVPLPAGGNAALALTVIPASGDYATGQAMATALAEGIRPLLGTLPASSC